MNRSRKTIYNSLLLGALFSATLAVGTGNAHAALGLDFTAAAPVENGGPATFGASDGYTTVGWSFKANTDLYLTRLGVYDADKDRIHSEQHNIGIWSAGSLLGSVMIGESSGNTPVASIPGNALFHYGNLNSPLVLHAGQIYYVGATLYSGAITTQGTLQNASDFDMFASIAAGDVPVTINPNITYLNSAYAISSTNQLTFPGTTYAAATYTVGANIDVTPTPIPAAAWLLGSGLMGLAGFRRKKD